MACAFSPDGRYIFSSGLDGALKIWDARNMRLVHSLIAHSPGNRWPCFSINPQSHIVVTSGSDSILSVFDLSSGSKTMALLESRRRLRDCALSSQGRYLLTAWADGTFSFFDTEEEMETKSFSAQAAAWLPDDSCRYLLILRPNEFLIKLWNVTNLREVTELRGYPYAITALSFSRDGRLMASVSSDGAVKIWDLNGAKPLAYLDDTVYQGCAFSPKGRHLAAFSRDGVRVWDVSRNKELFRVKSELGIKGLAYVDPGDRLAVWSYTRGGQIELWDTSKKDKYSFGHRYDLNTSDIRGHCFSHSGGRLLTWQRDNSLAVRDTRTGREISVFQGDEKSLSAISISPGGNKAAGGGESGIIKVWDEKTGKIMSLRGHSAAVTSCAINPEGCLILSGDKQGIIKVWDAGSGREIQSHQAHRGAVSHCAFLEDGKSFFTAGEDGGLRYGGVGDKLISLEENALSMTACSHSEDMGFIGAGLEEAGFELYATSMGRRLWGERGHIPYAFSADSAFLAAAIGREDVRLWETETGKLCREYKGHRDGVGALSLSPKGKCLSASTGKESYVWALPSGEHAGADPPRMVPSPNCMFTEDEKFLVSGLGEPTLRIWDSEAKECCVQLSGYCSTITTCLISTVSRRVLLADDRGRILFFSFENI
jgi:WD40 repeat protein